MATPKRRKLAAMIAHPIRMKWKPCAPILLQQIQILKPRVIVTLGSPSTKMILKTERRITGLRGKYFPFAVDGHYPRETPPAPESRSP